MKKILILAIAFLFLGLPSFADNWKKFNKHTYLNTDKTTYYKDKIGDDHAVIVEKHIINKKNKADKTVYDTYFKEYKKHLAYVLVVHDININKKTRTICYLMFIDKNEQNLGVEKMGTEQDCSPITPNSVDDAMYKYVVDNMKK